jgi:hypothetical protein
VLGDAARLLVDEVGGADGVEEGRLAVVDMPHDGDDGRPLGEFVRPALGASAHGLVEGDEFRLEVRDHGDDLGQLGVDEFIKVGGETLGGELIQDVLGPDLHRHGRILQEPALAESDFLFWLGRHRCRRFLSGRRGRGRPRGSLLRCGRGSRRGRRGGGGLGRSRRGSRRPGDARRGLGGGSCGGRRSRGLMRLGHGLGSGGRFVSRRLRDLRLSCGRLSCGRLWRRRFARGPFCSFLGGGFLG